MMGKEVIGLHCSKTHLGLAHGENILMEKDYQARTDTTTKSSRISGSGHKH